MKQFLMQIRAKSETRHVNVVELSYWDMIKLIFGREIPAALLPGKDSTTHTLIRIGTAYSAFNLSAPRADGPEVGEGYTRKGGQNAWPSQIKKRPQPPGAIDGG